MSTELELTLNDPRKEVTLSPAAMMQAVIDKGISSENVSVLEKLIELHERMEVRKAERAFAEAFAELQAQMPSVAMTKAVPDKNGNIKFRFSPYEEIMATVRPLLLKHGFTVTFSMDFKEGRIIQSCTLQHTGGHSRTNQFMARIGNGPPGASDCQADGAASTYAKRFALCNALNIVTEIDNGGENDARNEGAPISFEQAQTLREMVAEVKADPVRFLRYAGAPSFEEIGASRYAALFSELQKRRTAQ